MDSTFHPSVEHFHAVGGRERFPPVSMTCHAAMSYIASGRQGHRVAQDRADPALCNTIAGLTKRVRAYWSC